MSSAFTRPTEPEGLTASLLERFNTGEVSAMMGLYEEGAVFVTNSGEPVTDPAEIERHLEGFMSFGLPMKANARHVYVAGDVALIVLDWEVEGTGPDGSHVHLKGSATDVAHRGADGFWRYAIDNPYGTRFREQV
jgi:ketosteroid isomerase-like protein